MIVKDNGRDGGKENPGFVLRCFWIPCSILVYAVCVFCLFVCRMGGESNACNRFFSMCDLIFFTPFSFRDQVFHS